MAHVGEVEAHKGMLTGQVTTLRSKWSNATNDNMRLQAEVGTLRKTLQVCASRLAAYCVADFLNQAPAGHVATLCKTSQKVV